MLSRSGKSCTSVIALGVKISLENTKQTHKSFRVQVFYVKCKKRKVPCCLGQTSLACPPAVRGELYRWCFRRTISEFSVRTRCSVPKTLTGRSFYVIFFASAGADGHKYIAWFVSVFYCTQCIFVSTVELVPWPEHGEGRVPDALGNRTL